MDNKVLYTIKEAAGYLGVSPSTISRMEVLGLLTSSKISKGQRFYSQKDIEECLRKYESSDMSLIKEARSTYEPSTWVKPYFETKTIKIYCADLLKIDIIKEDSIDLIITSPPYNVGIKYNPHDDTMTYKDYLSFTERWLAKCYKLTKEDGRFCLNIPLDKNKGGQQSVCADITTIAKRVGWRYHSTIIWNEQNISKRTAWGSWLSASAPYVIAPVEVIVVLYKERWKKISGSRKSDITRKELVEWTNGVCGILWVKVRKKLVPRHHFLLNYLKDV